jgi:hypothetical protein
MDPRWSPRLVGIVLVLAGQISTNITPTKPISKVEADLERPRMAEPGAVTINHLSRM